MENNKEDKKIHDDKDFFSTIKSDEATGSLFLSIAIIVLMFILSLFFGD